MREAWRREGAWHVAQGLGPRCLLEGASGMPLLCVSAWLRACIHVHRPVFSLAQSTLRKKQLGHNQHEGTRPRNSHPAMQAHPPTSARMLQPRMRVAAPWPVAYTPNMHPEMLHFSTFAWVGLPSIVFTCGRRTWGEAACACLVWFVLHGHAPTPCM